MSEPTVVIGGGAIGLSVAWELARRGDPVRLLEREGQVGRGTSWAAAGILPPARLDTATDPIDRLRGLSHELFGSWSQQLMSTTGIDPGFARCGGWYLAGSLGERASMIGMTGYWRELGIDCQPVTASHLSSAEPALRLPPSGTIPAWWVPDECQVRSPDYLRALEAACRAAGVRIDSDAPVDDLQWRAGSATVQTRGQRIHAARVILCGGTWSDRIADRLRLRSAIVPVRGQILLLKTPQPLLRSIVNVGHRYLVCRSDGHTLVGSSEEEVGFTSGTTPETIESLREFAEHWVPGLRKAETVRTWSGLRPMTFDGFPIIGRVPATENLFVATGHFRSGIHLSPATAVVLADLIHGCKPDVDLDAFRVGGQPPEPPLPSDANG
jgi:glycine oxidase